MTASTFAIAAAALGVSFLLTLGIRRAARGLGLIDIPNERSSHAVPTPTGGGLAIVVSATAALGLLAAVGLVPARLFLVLGPGGAAVAAVGFIDDRKTLSARIRLFIHFAAAAWAVAWIGPVDLFGTAGEASGLQWLNYAVSTVGIAWFLNMFNFMDGIDAIAASEAVFLCVGTSLLALYSAGVSYIAASVVVIGATSAGFLMWNWPPAKIFMGDVGSGYVGFALAVLGLASGAHSGSALCACLILAGVFVVDATFTLLRRFVRGERVTEPHRTHAFQLLAQRVGHRKATMTVALVNLVWLLPCALASVLMPENALWITLLAYGPLLVGAFALGAGRPQVLPVTQPSAGVVIQFRFARTSERSVFASTQEHGVTERKVHDVG
ncbi:MAG TPA: glycosyltransferase family 4 protein [Steroidobacteraceae bacterium]